MYGSYQQQSYYPQLYPQSPTPQNGAPQLIKVNGMESAKAYPTMPNSTVALFDANEDVMYIKSSDASNFPTIRRFIFIEEAEPQQTKQQYVTMDEFLKFKEEILNGKQSV